MFGYLRDAAESLQALPELAEARARVPMRWYGRMVKAAEKAGRDSAARIDRPDMFDLGAAAGAVAAFLAEHAPQGLPVRPDASDYEICMKARKIAADVLLRTTGLSTADALIVCQRECEQQGVDMPDVQVPNADTMTDAEKEAAKAPGQVARVRCELWWRRRLRTAHIRALEHSNIRLHYVHYRSDPYASNDAVRRRVAQNRRNAATLAATTLENEHGQRFTLAELAEKSVANKALRRGELMTRLKGAEELADAAAFAGVMFTLTCPSRFHAVKQLGHKWKPNPNYDDSLDPRAAQLYLRGVWARIRAELARLGVTYFGVRVAEPHHDGCPHWHGLVFSNDIDVVCSVIRKHGLRDTPDERGADVRRVRFERIDRAKGSAVGYIAKYIAKNIDGHAVGDHKTDEGYVVQADILGDDVITPSQRVEAWAACWGIRQFQFVGGAPVGVWRELRRVKEADLPGADESQAIRDAWAAAQRTEDKPASWADYARAMGGVAGEGKRIKIRYTERMEAGRYGLALRKLPQGVQAIGRAHIVDGIANYWAAAPIFVPATRYQWTKVERSGEAASTRTRVNNCTRPSGAASAGQTRPAWMDGLHGPETAPEGAQT
ncbi:bacteriophage replication protein [Cupriavidus sp. TA19]|uniref:replication endonuclease n=1 Tax=Cupriavidus sp. TA19 TaxID=701108 RepID=UPI002729420E|nr:replication endonuclease [Cupriavidus sp. TA19]GLC96850.1 bacteriophage replication protein [Cupriavidus sp. TA19]